MRFLSLGFSLLLVLVLLASAHGTDLGPIQETEDAPKVQIADLRPNDVEDGLSAPLYGGEDDRPVPCLVQVCNCSVESKRMAIKNLLCLLGTTLFIGYLVFMVYELLMASPYKGPSIQNHKAFD
jgi:hypothetical protein